MSFTIIAAGSFIQPSTAVNQIIALPSSCDYFKTYNITQMPLTPATPVVVMAEWFGGGLFADNDGLRWKKSANTSVLNLDTFGTATASNGFTYITSFPAPQAALTGTTITNATPAVATVTNTYSNGDQVVIYNSTGALMYSGMTFTISSVSGSGFTLLGLNTPGSAATAFTVRRVSSVMPVEPQFYYVTAITQATQAQVTTSQINNAYVGQKIEFQIPGSFGMVQLNNFNQPQSKPPIVTSIVDAYNFLININTTNYTAFAFPATALTPTTQLFATYAPAGSATTSNEFTGVTTGYNFPAGAFHSGLFLPSMQVSAGAQSPGGAGLDRVVWTAYKFNNGIQNSPNGN